MSQGIQGYFIGNLGSDPESRNNGCKFSVATHTFRKGDQTTQWVDVLAFGKTSEQCLEYLNKGRKVFIQGRFEIDYSPDRKDKDGNPYSPKLTVFANRVDFLDKSPSNNE